MTYWPISAPSIYSVGSPSQNYITVSDDDARAEAESPVKSTGEDTENSTNTRRTSPATDEEYNKDGGQKPLESSVPRIEAEGDEGIDDEGIDAKQKISGSNTRPNPLTENIIGAKLTKNGSMFATITSKTLTVWQTKPSAVIASVIRSDQSLGTYGPNVALWIRPDSAIFVVQTDRGYLINYSLALDPAAHVYKPQLIAGNHSHSRRQSTTVSYGRRQDTESNAGPGEGEGVREASLRFRMVIKVDAGISKVLVLEDELIVATEKPPALQCIRWTPDSKGNQTSTELVSRIPWIGKKISITDMVHDRPMNLSAWITADGRAYAVQRGVSRVAASAISEDLAAPKALFNGYAFHQPTSQDEYGVKAAINARFSLIAVGCANGDICVYTARDYTGNIPLSHKLRSNVATGSPGKLNLLMYSPDGYCLFAGYEHGWIMWSVYGKPGATSFSSDRSTSSKNNEEWLLGVRDGFFVGGGCELFLLGVSDNRLWKLEMARSAVAGCYSSANVTRSLLQTNTGFMIYRGYDSPDLTTISSDASLWHHVQVPSYYLINQWPIRSAVISSDGRYVAVAGRRGLAHYSVTSGRWRTFDDVLMENEFTVRGGMCWHHHVLIAAVEANNSHEIRVYSRETALDNSHILFTERLGAPIVLLAPSGDDSLLVYTYENTLYHYIINVTDGSMQLIRVGQIALHGIIRAPPRVRALSWVLPDGQLHNGDPSQDVAVASIVFLVDGKLVLLQPSTTEDGGLKYDMRIIAQNVEYHVLMRDHPSFNLQAQDAGAHASTPLSATPTLTSPSTMTGTITSPQGVTTSMLQGHDLKDSLWLFDGQDMRVWMDVQDILVSAPMELGRELPTAVKVAVDFYPLSVLLDKGVLFGVETEFVQRRDINFAFLRFVTRTQLFLPALLRHELSQYNSPAALHLSGFYSHLEYFPHALEMLLHDVLDDEVDSGVALEQALLPSVVSFLSAFPAYLDIVVQCTRKTELRSWRTLFAHLPPPQELFETALERGSLKTAGGYLLVLHTLEELEPGSQQILQLLQRAWDQQDWDLCKELARFLMALDDSGATLRSTLQRINEGTPSAVKAQMLSGKPASGL